MMLLSFLVSFIGFVLISLSMNRHFKQLMPDRAALSSKQAIALRLLGFTCLMIAATVAMVSQGVGLGLTYWAGLLSVAATLQALLLTYQPHWFISQTWIVTIILGRKA